jgi:glycosyltransferase involved in cell wall biosynthesis
MSARPPVAQVITRLIVGGAQHTVAELCEGLKDDFEMHVVCGPDTGPEGSILEDISAHARVTVVDELRREVRPRQDVAAVRALRRTLSDIAPAVVHTHSSKAGVLGRRAARSILAPKVHTVHGWGHTPDDHFLKRKIYVELERRAAEWSDALVAVSPEVRDDGLTQGIGWPDLYRVIPEGVDFSPTCDDHETARGRARSALGLGADQEVIGWVGRFVPQKDPATLRATLATILAQRPQTVAVLIGDGPMRESFERDMQADRLGDRVLCVGLRERARELMPAFDVLLHLTRWEGQPRVVQEALAERVPVVATRTSGVPELVRPHRTGHVVEIGDAAAAADRAIGILAGADPVSAPLRPGEIAELERRNGIAHVLDCHLRLYRELANGRT